MADAGSDPVAAALAEIQEHNERVIALCDMAPASVQQLAEYDVPRLLKAVEAALEQADDWDQEYARLKPSGADAVSNPGPGSYLVSGRLGALKNCAEGLREAITAALTEQEADDGG